MSSTSPQCADTNGGLHRRLALAGGGGSHVSTIAAVCDALPIAGSSVEPLVLDLSLFDTRGRADYSKLPAKLIKPDPSALGFRQIFRTAAPNLVVSGGVRRFEALIEHFSKILRHENVGAVLICHAYGIPEQALIQACRRCDIPLAQIDEGPFSVLVKARGAPTPGLPASKSLALKLLKRAGLLPERDWSGTDIDVFFPTSAKRARAVESAGIPTERIHLVSAPRFDRLASACDSWRRAQRERALARSTPRVLVLHQPFRRDGKVRPAAAARAEKALFDALGQVARQRSIEVAVRMHPRADQAERTRYESWLAGIPATHSLTGGGDFYDELPAFDLFAGFYSSSLLEAAAAGAPTVGVSIPSKAFYRGGEGAKAAAMGQLGVNMADSADALRILIERGLESGNQTPPAALFDEQLGPLNVDGALSVARHLLRLAAG